MSFIFYKSNSQEILLDWLTDKFFSSKNPLITDIIVIQNFGMKRWIEIEITKNRGAFGNCKFLFPHQLLNYLIEEVMGEKARDNFLSSNLLSWQIYSLLHEYQKNKIFEELISYQSSFEFGYYQLSCYLAELFEKYSIHDPDIFEKKEIKNNPQQVLWQNLYDKCELDNYNSIVNKLFETIDKSESNKKKLPQRIFIFGIPYLPYFHLNFFDTLSKYTDIYFFYNVPTKEYWSDLTTPRNILKTKALLKKKQNADDLHYEQGHPFIAQLGKKGIAFQKLIEDYNWYFEPVIEKFIFKKEDTILNVIQNNILNLQENPIPSDIAVNTPTSSLQIHSCYSTLSEIEVLHNHILEWLEQDVSLNPSDIIVKCPNIDEYEAIIKGIFDASPNIIPYNVASNRSLLNKSVVKCLLKFFELPYSRFELKEIEFFLKCPEIMKKFNLSEKDVAILLGKFAQVGIEWGINLDFINKYQTAEEDYISWEYGLNRILNGYTNLDAQPINFYEYAPFDIGNNNEYEILGNFLDFFSKLKLLYCPQEGWLKAKSLRQWVSVIKKIIDTFFEFTQINENLEFLQFIEKLTQEFEQANIDIEVNYQSIKLRLEKLFTKSGTSTPFLSKGVTFCEITSMCSIPFKVMAFIGMDNDSFPRRQFIMDLDIMQKFSNDNYIDPRNEDLYIFLESLILTNQIFYISYIGKNIEDNKKKTPSVAVDFILEYLTANTSIKNKASWVIEHPEYSFSEKNFGSNLHLFSYSKFYKGLAEKLQNQKQVEETNIITDEKINTPLHSNIAIYDLISFYQNPPYYFQKKQMQIDMDIPIETVEDFKINHLELYKFRKYILKTNIDLGLQFNEKLAIESYIKRGNFGFYNLYQHTLKGQKQLNLLMDATLKLLKEKTPSNFEIDIYFEEMYLYGNICPIYGDSVVLWEPIYINPDEKNPKAKYMIKLGIIALLAQNFMPDIKQVMLIGMDGKLECIFYDEAKTVLKKMLTIFTSNSLQPVAFFPNQAFEWVKGKKPKDKILSELFDDKNLNIDRQEIQKLYPNLDTAKKQFDFITNEIAAPIFKNQKFEKYDAI